MKFAPSLLKRLSWQTALLSLVSGGIIHICATLVMPELATANGVSRLTAELPSNRMRVLSPTSAEDQVLPFMGADVRMAICRFDVADGPINVNAVLPDKGWTLGLYSLAGDNFYVVPAQELRHTEVAFQLVPQTERFLGLFSLARQAETNASQIRVPQTQGLVVIRAPLRGRAFQSDTETTLQRARCGSQRPS